MTTINSPKQDKQDAFLAWVRNWSTSSLVPVFSYLALAVGNEWQVIKAVLVLNAERSTFSGPEKFCFGKIRAGHCEIKGGAAALEQFCQELFRGHFSIGDQRARILDQDEWN